MHETSSLNSLHYNGIHPREGWEGLRLMWGEMLTLVALANQHSSDKLPVGLGWNSLALANNETHAGVGLSFCCLSLALSNWHRSANIGEARSEMLKFTRTCKQE